MIYYTKELGWTKDGIAEQKRRAMRVAYLLRWVPVWMATFNLGLSLGHAWCHRWVWSGVFFFATAVFCGLAKRGALVSRELINNSVIQQTSAARVGQAVSGGSR